MTVALRLLARRARSAEEMRRALAERGVAAASVRRVLGRLRELGYIDDRKLAAEWTETLEARGFGSLRIRERLRRQGVDERLAQGAAPSAAAERATARRVLESRFGEAPIVDRREKGRAYRFLAARGFPHEVVESVLDLWEE